MRVQLTLLFILMNLSSQCDKGCLKCDKSNCLLCDVINNYFLLNDNCELIQTDNCLILDSSGNCNLCKTDFYIENTTKKCVKVDSIKKIDLCR